MQQLVSVSEAAVRNEGKLKSYNSCTDIRAWHSRAAVRSKYLRECMHQNNLPQHIPTSVMIDIVQRMAPTPEDSLKAYARCKSDCKSKAFINTLYAVCNAMEECLKSKECLRNYFDEEEYKSQYWPRDAALDMLRVIRIIWSAVVEDVLKISLAEAPSSSKKHEIVKNIPSIAKEWQKEMIRQTKHVKSSPEPDGFPANLQNQPCQLCVGAIEKTNKSISAQIETKDKFCECIENCTNKTTVGEEICPYCISTVKKKNKSVSTTVEKKDKSCEAFEYMKRYTNKQPCQCCSKSNGKINKYVLVRVDNKDKYCQPVKDIDKENKIELPNHGFCARTKNKNKSSDFICECNKTILVDGTLARVENKDKNYKPIEYLKNNSAVKLTNNKSVTAAQVKNKEKGCEPIAENNKIFLDNKFKSDKFIWARVKMEHRSSEITEFAFKSNKSISVGVKNRNEGCEPIEEVTKMYQEDIKFKQNLLKCDKCISAHVINIDKCCDPIVDTIKVNLDDCILKFKSLENQFNIQSCEMNRLTRENSEIKLYLEEANRQKNYVSDELEKCRIKLNHFSQKTEKVHRGEQMDVEVNKNCPKLCDINETSSGQSAGDVESEISIILDTSQNEHFRCVSLLQVLHKTNKPLLRQEMALGCTCKVEDPAEILSKVKKAFGYIVKREFSKIKKQKSKKNDDRMEITATSEVKPDNNSDVLPAQPLPACSKSSSPQFGVWRFSF